MKLKIKEMRKRANCTQGELANGINVSLRTVGSWEREESTPNAEQLWDMAVFLRCTPNDLLGWIEGIGFEDTIEHELLDNYRSSTPERQDSLIDISRDFAVMSKDASKRDELPQKEAS